MPDPKDILLEKENRAKDLLENYKADNNPNKTNKIIDELGAEYFQILKILNSKEKDDEVKAKLGGYLAQALKFGSLESSTYFISTILMNWDTSVTRSSCILLFNTFILSLDSTDNVLDNLQQTVYTKIFATLRKIKNDTILSIVNFLEQQLRNFKQSDTELLSKKINTFLVNISSTQNRDFKSFGYEGWQIFLLIKFCIEKKFISQAYLLAYTDYFKGLAEKYPKEYGILSCISNSEDLNNKEILENIVTLAKADNFLFFEWENKMFDQITYWKIRQYFGVQPIALKDVVLQFDSISPSYKIPLNDNLLELMRKIVDSGRLDYIQKILDVIKNKTVVNISEIQGPTLENRFASFYHFYSQPEMLFHFILPIRLNEIKNEIEMEILRLTKEKQSNGKFRRFIGNITSSFWNQENILLILTNVLKNLEALIFTPPIILQDAATSQEFKKQTDETVATAEIVIEELEKNKGLLANREQTSELLKSITILHSDLKNLLKKFPEYTKKEIAKEEEATPPGLSN